MGSITFQLPKSVPPVAHETLGRAVFAHGFEQTVDATTVKVADGRLVANFVLDESGSLLVPWPVGPFGCVTASTTTLLAREEPYRLLVELARGKLNQVRTQTAEWESIGLELPPSFGRDLADVMRTFAKAVFAPPDESDALATRILEQSFTLADALTREFISQLFDSRHHEEGRLDTRLAARTTTEWGELTADYTRTFNAAQIALRWSDVEPSESDYQWEATDKAIAAAKSAGLPITVGPVIDLATGMVPEWVLSWVGDLPTLAAFMCDFLETAMRRYKGDVDRWIVCAGFNHADSLGLDDDERLRLAFRLFEAANHADSETDLIVSIAQPWSDYLVREEHTISPLTFPDDLIRSGLRVSAVDVELRFGTVPRGSLPRDLLDTARLLGVFAGLGLPLEVSLSLPASSDSDLIATAHGQSLWSPGWLSGPSAEGQAEWGASFAALGLASPHIRAVTWDHWSDAAPHLTPSGGVIDTTGRQKALLARLRSLRDQHLC